MSKRITLKLPQPPSVNNYWSVCRRGGKTYKYLNNAGRSYRKDVLALFGSFKEPHFEGKCKLTVTWYMRDRRRRDIDNYLKALLDVLDHMNCYKDDEQVYELHVFKLLAYREEDKAQMIIQLEELEEK